jgi:hypothetical protein
MAEDACRMLEVIRVFALTKLLTTVAAMESSIRVLQRVKSFQASTITFLIYFRKNMFIVTLRAELLFEIVPKVPDGIKQFIRVPQRPTQPLTMFNQLCNKSTRSQ